MSLNSTPARWLSYDSLDTGAGVRLFCLPPLGGSVHVFHGWNALLSPLIGVYAVQLPGRGNRLLEPPFRGMVPLIEELSKALQPYLSTPFAIFGHSMGALVGFELVRHFRHAYKIQPLHLFVSGSCAPQSTNGEGAIHTLPEQDFIKAVRLRKEIPEEVFEQPELVSLLLPTLRADFEVFQSYVHVPEPPLDCPITAFGGRQDPSISKRCLRGWRKQTKGEFSTQMFDGNHQLTTMAQAKLLKSISERLQVPNR